MVRTVYLAALAATFFSFDTKALMAEEGARQGPPRWTVGALGLVNRSPFELENTDADGDEKYQNMVVPYIAYRGDNFYLEGLEAGFHLLKPADGSDLTLSLDVIASARMQTGESRDSITADAGLRAKVAGPFGELAITGLQDVTGEHDGREFAARYSYSFTGQKWIITPSVGVVWQSEGLADHMWGVTAEEQADMIADGDPVLPLYQIGDSVLNYEAGLFASYRFGGGWSVIGFGSVTFLDDKIKANPGINKDIDATIGLGLAYSF